MVIMLKYSPNLYSLSSPEIKLINMTIAVDSRISILKNWEKGSSATVSIKRVVGVAS